MPVELPQIITVVDCSERRLLIRVAEAFRVAEAHRYFAEIDQLASGRGVARILVDAREYKASLSFTERLQLALAAVAKLRAYRVAVIGSEATVAGQRIGETIANSRGANVRVFTGAADAEAEKWLDL